MALSFHQVEDIYDTPEEALEILETENNDGLQGNRWFFFKHPLHPIHRKKSTVAFIRSCQPIATPFSLSMRILVINGNILYVMMDYFEPVWKVS